MIAAVNNVPTTRKERVEKAANEREKNDSYGHCATRILKAR